MVNFKKIGYTGLFVGILFISSTVLFFFKNPRNGLREFFAPPERKILSVATGRIFPENSGRVVKLSTPDGIVLEVFSFTNSPHEEQLVDKIELGDHGDAHIQFQAQATNLALKDMDNDQIFEIIVPTYNRSLVPKLSIFRYNSDSKKFEPYIE